MFEPWERTFRTQRMDALLFALMAAMLLLAGAVVYRSAHPSGRAATPSPATGLVPRARPKDPAVLNKNFESGHFSRKEAWHYRQVDRSGRAQPAH